MSDRITGHDGPARMEFDQIYSVISGLEKRIADLETKNRNTLPTVQSGWSVTNLTPTRTLDASALTLDSQVLGTVISDLIAKRIISQ